MQITNILGASALLSTVVFAAPQNQQAREALVRRFWSGSVHDPFLTTAPFMTGSSTVFPATTTADPCASQSRRKHSHKTKGWATGDSCPYYPTSGPHATGGSGFNHTAKPSGYNATISCTTPAYTTIFATLNVTRTTYIAPFTTNNTATYLPTGTGYLSGTGYSTHTPAVNTTSAVSPTNGTVSTRMTSMASASSSLVTSTNTTAPIYTFSQKTRTRTRTRTNTKTMTVSAISTVTTSPPPPATSTLAVSDFIPVTTTTTILYPTSSMVATTIISGSSAPSGTPAPHALLCNVHGLPVGDYYLGRFVQKSQTASVTLYSCYQFCASIAGIAMSCQSFEFYYENTGAPRCNLYSGSVAQSLDRIQPGVQNTWYDMGCVVPYNATIDG